MSNNNIVNLIQARLVVDSVKHNVVCLLAVQSLFPHLLHLSYQLTDHSSPSQVAIGCYETKISVPHDACRPVVPDLEHLDVDVLGVCLVDEGKCGVLKIDA